MRNNHGAHLNERAGPTGFYSREWTLHPFYKEKGGFGASKGLTARLYWPETDKLNPNHIQPFHYYLMMEKELLCQKVGCVNCDVSNKANVFISFFLMYYFLRVILILQFTL